MSEEELAALRANSELAITTFKDRSGIDFGFDRDSVAWLEGFIDRQRTVEPSPSPMITAVLGSHLGHSIIAAAGGTWARDEVGQVGVQFDNGDWCYPFAKVAKQIESGAGVGDGILSFYDVSVEYLATGRLPGRPATGHRAN
ncbi:MAG: hypothetical protein Q7T86_08935 [Hyphomicrobiaceae bacterium]|nr:hypothetical protein [Hyphomicrobiaceae bacterium]